MRLRLARADFQEQIHRWLRERPTRWERIYRWAQASRYRLRQRRQDRPLLAYVLERVTQTTIYVLAPLTSWFVYKTITFLQFLLASVGILVVQGLLTLSKRIGKPKEELEDNALSDAILRMGEVIGPLRKARPPAKGTDQALRGCLGIVEAFARDITESRKGEISATLLVYTSKVRDEFEVLHRNPGNNRPVGRVVPAEGLFGHYACMAGPDPRVINDVHEFPTRPVLSPTQSSPTYRSIFIAPIYDKATHYVWGCVTVDCPRPYAFFGNRANVMSVNCEPVFDHITQLLGRRA